MSNHSQREEGGMTRELMPAHKSVMQAEAIEALNLQHGDLVVDATAGQGGHSESILSIAGTRVLALDADAQAVDATKARVASFGARATVVHSNFGELEHVLKHQNVTTINKALFDLGWSSAQPQSGRGFSFQSDEPLIMSYGEQPASGFTAEEALTQWDEETLANVFYGYGEERYAKRIARAVIDRRAVAPIKTTFEFVELIKDAVPAMYRHGRIHPATRSFQALRIAVNDELSVIERGITAAWAHLAIGGRLAVITFHSIEDRLVKNLCAQFVKDGGGQLVYKKPLVPSTEEIQTNPRARSAKLRAIEKIS